MEKGQQATWHRNAGLKVSITAFKQAGSYNVRKF